MLSPSLLLQLPSGSLLPFLEPVRTLWPTTGAIFARAEQDWIETMKELTKSMEQVDEFHRLLLQELTMPNQAHGGTPDNSLRGSSQKEKTRGTFALSMAIPGFSANELTLKLVGRKLLLLGSKETKKQGDDGSISYKNELIRRESDLPEAVNLKGLACYLSSDGQLCVEGSLQEPPATIERDVPIQLSKEQSPGIERNVPIQLSKELSPENERNVPIQLGKELSPEIERKVPVQLSTAPASSARPEKQSGGDGVKMAAK